MRAEVQIVGECVRTGRLLRFRGSIEEGEVVLQGGEVSKHVDEDLEAVGCDGHAGRDLHGGRMVERTE